VNIQINFTSSETRSIVLPEAENHTIISSFVWTQYRNVTDEQTDRIPLASTAVCIASYADMLWKVKENRQPLPLALCWHTM